MAFAVARGAFLAKADLSGTNLRDADLRGAQLHQAILRNADLRGADLRGARLQLVDFRDADLRGANLEGAQLRGAGFVRARLQGANLSHAHFHGAYLRDAKLQGAVLKGAQLQGAVLASAGLQGADLTESRLEGADLGKAALWRAIVDGAVWDAADVRGTHLLPFGDAGTLVADVTAAISNGGRRKEATERLVAAFEGEDRASRPDFPDLWRVLPNVMFDENDPVPEPFDWGPRTWTQEEYERTLGEMLGNLGCHDDQPPAQTRGLAWRAIQSGQRERLYAQRLAARLTGDDCPPAAGLPEDIRRQLESLAARDDNKVAATPEMLPSDPAE